MGTNDNESYIGLHISWIEKKKKVLWGQMQNLSVT